MLHSLRGRLVNTAQIQKIDEAELRLPSCPAPDSGGVSMGTKTTYVCDCCLRESDSNLGWTHLHINGADGGKQLMPDDDRDLCEICWSPMQTLMKKIHAEAQERRNSGQP
jgi:hypothetical protein